MSRHAMSNPFFEAQFNLDGLITKFRNSVVAADDFDSDALSQLCTIMACAGMLDAHDKLSDRQFKGVRACEQKAQHLLALLRDE